MLEVELSSGEVTLAGDSELVQVWVYLCGRLQRGTAATGRCVLPWAEVSTHIPTPQGLRLDHAAGGVDLKPDVKETIFSPCIWKDFLLNQQSEKWPALQQL